METESRKFDLRERGMDDSAITKHLRYRKTFYLDNHGFDAS